MTAPIILTNMVNGRPKNVVLTLYLTPEEFQRGCKKIVKIVRRGKMGFEQSFELEVDVPMHAVKGTVYTFDNAGDYLGNDMFQNINVMLESTDSNAQCFYGHPQQVDASTFQAWKLAPYGTTEPQVSMPQQPAMLAANDPNVSGYPRTSSSSIPSFSQLKVFKEGEYDISYFPNGDVGVQLRFSVQSLASPFFNFKQTLADGSRLRLFARDVQTVGIPEYKPRMFTPVIGSNLTGNILLLAIGDNANAPSNRHLSSALCC